MKQPSRRQLARWSAILAITFAMVEFLLRALTHSLFIWGDWHVIDPVVGHVPRPGFAIDIPWIMRITIEENGFRSNGQMPKPGGGPITLAVGDSYTFGEGANDDDNWPAQLEQITGRRVLNGGVTGFGLDQTVLRAEQLAEIYKPDMTIVSFIADDIRRCELSRFSGHAKPYFDLDADGNLVYRPATHPRPWFWKRILRLSLTLQIFASEFLYSEGLDVTTRGPNQISISHEIACALMARLGRLQRLSGADMLVIAQPASPAEISGPSEQEVRMALDCAEANGLQTLNLFPTLRPIPSANGRHCMMAT